MRQSAWLTGGRVAGVAAGTLVNALLARLLIPSSLGVYFLSSSILGFASTFAQFGMKEAAVRLIAESVARNELGRARSAIRRTLVFAVAGAALVGGALALGGWRRMAIPVFHSAEMATISGLAVVWLFVLVVQGLLVAHLKGLQAMRFVALFDGLLASVLSGVFLLFVWVVHGPVSLNVIVTLTVVALGTTVVAAVVPAWHRTRLLTGSGAVSVSEVTRIAWPMMVTGLLSAAVGSASDLWILAAFRPKGEVAVYAASLRLATLLSLPFAAFAVALAPMIAELNAKNRRVELERLIRAGTAFVAIPALAALVVFGLFGRPLLALIFGPFFASGAPILIAVTVAQSVFVLTGPCGLVLVMTGHQVTMMVLAAFAAALSVGADLWAAPRFGAMGVAVATGSAQVLTNVLGLVLAKRLTGVWTLARFSTNDARALFRVLRSGPRRGAT